MVGQKGAEVADGEENGKDGKVGIQMQDGMGIKQDVQEEKGKDILNKHGVAQVKDNHRVGKNVR